MACNDAREPRAASGPPAIIPSSGGWGSAADLAKLPGELWFVRNSDPPMLVRVRGGVREDIAERIVPHGKLPDGRLVGVRTSATGDQLVLVDGSGAPAFGPHAKRISEAVVDREGRFVVAAVEDDGGNASRTTPAVTIVRVEVATGQSTRLAAGHSPTLFGDRVAFVADGDLFGMKLSGGDPVPLVRTPAQEAAPRASKDGVLLFTSDREGPRRLFVLRHGDGGGNERRLTERTEPTREERSHAWSPDGRFVAYVVQRGTRRHVWIRDVESRSEVDVTPEGIHDDEPAFSPDGRWVVVQRTRGHDVDLWAIPTGVGEPVRVTTGRFSDSQPRWF